jgi:hypothetical protein
MSIGAALKLFVFALIVFAVAFGLRRSFFWDVTPVSWDQEPQSLWALGRCIFAALAREYRRRRGRPHFDRRGRASADPPARRLKPGYARSTRAA